MTLYDIVKKYGEGNGEDTMWSTLTLVSDAVESTMTASEKNSLLRKVYGVMSGGHYNEEFAREDIARMYYEDKNGVKHYAPYWPDSALKALYEKHKEDIPGYNCWDWMVTMNMVKSDNCPLLLEWFPRIDEDEKNEKIVQLALNWLVDEDNPFGTSKIWCYFNSKI